MTADRDRRLIGQDDAVLGRQLRRALSAVAILCVAIVSIGCSSSDGEGASTTEVAPETTADPVAADKQLIVQMWRQLSDASSGGFEAWLQESVDTQYPGSGITLEQCMAAYLKGAEPPAGFRFTATVDPDTIEADPDWEVPSGPLEGTTPEGRTYKMTLTQEGQSDTSPPQTVEQEVRVTVLDGVAYQFPGCDGAA